MLQADANGMNIDKRKRSCTSSNYRNMRISEDMNMEILMGTNANISSYKRKVKGLLQSGSRQVVGKINSCTIAE